MIIIFIFLGLVLGFTIPLIFIFLDLRELSLPLNLENALDIISSQNIYPFSLALFPILFTILFILIHILMKRNETAENSKKFVSQIFQSLEDPLFVVNEKKELLQNNEAYFSLEEKLNTNLLHNLTTNKNFGFPFTEDECHLDINYENGVKKFNLLLSTRKSLDLNNEVIWIGAIKDVTEYRENLKLIEEQNLSLERQSRLTSLGELAGGMAHEINNPLAIILGWCFKLKKAANNDQLDQDFILYSAEKIANTVHRISTLTSVLLNLSNSRKSIPKEETTLDEVLEEVKTLAFTTLRESDIKMTIKEGDANAVPIYLQKISLIQILTSLIHNSADAIRDLPEKYIRIISESSSGSILLHIQDSGRGIDPEVVDKMFNPMFTTKELGEGTGLGLSLCHSLAKDMDAELYYNQDYPNTTFTMKIPLLAGQR